MEQNLDQSISIAACRPKIAGRRFPTAEDKAHRRAQWPREVRNRGKRIFSRPHTLRYDGKSYRLEIRSSKGKGFWIMVDGGAVLCGATEPIALANVIKAVDPEVETVRDTRGRVLV
jgi:hypothetical protein